MQNESELADHLRTTPLPPDFAISYRAHVVELCGEHNADQIIAALEHSGRTEADSEVYFMRRHSDGLIKIGYTKTVRNRRKMLEKEHGCPVDVLAAIQGGAFLEGQYHVHFEQHNVEGEWFAPAPEIMAEIERLGPWAAPLDRRKTRPMQNQFGPESAETDPAHHTMMEHRMNSEFISADREWRYGRATRISPIIENGKLVAIFTEDGRNIHPLIQRPFTPPAIETFEEEARRLHAIADRENPRPEKCYFVGGEEGAIKIGKSLDPVKRLRQMQAHSPIELHILAIAPGGGARERAYHAQFGEHSSHGEWFARHPDILAEIARLQEQPA